MNASAEDIPSEVSEAEAFGLETAASEKIYVPRLLTSSIPVECGFGRAISFKLTEEVCA